MTERQTTASEAAERELEGKAARDLEAAGFVVIREARPTPGRAFGALIHADVSGWSAGESGELEPEVVVEVKRRSRLPVATTVLAYLSRVAAAFRARRAFLYDGAWHEANEEFTRFETSACPKPTRAYATARVPRALLESELWHLENSERARASVRRGEEWVEFVVNSVTSGSAGALAKLCVAKSTRIALARLLCGKAGELEAPEALTGAMARLLAPHSGDLVLDPTCKLGGALWAVSEAQPDVSLEGWWTGSGSVSITKSLAAYCEVDARFTCASFEEILAKPAQVDRLIALPPFGLKLPVRAALESDPRGTFEFDIAFLDRVPEWLRDNGRAVVAMPPRVLFSESASGVRQRLAHSFRVAAVVEVPSGVFETVKLPVVIIVIEKKPPTRSLVARLEADWVDQLAPTGEFFQAYQKHLAGESP